MKLYAVAAPAVVRLDGDSRDVETYIINKAHGSHRSDVQPAVYTSKKKAEKYRDHMAKHYPEIPYKVVEIDGSLQAYGVDK